MAPAEPFGAELRIRQKRSQITYDALIDTCFELLREKEFDEISIAELAQEAGYSVGAFYARFKSKDELFDAMVRQHVENRREVRRRQFATAGDDELLHELLDETVHYYWGRRRFWRALLARFAARAGRALTGAQQVNVRFAVQLAFGLINNTILNRPGPFFLEQNLFVENLVRAFKLVSGYDDLGAPRAGRGAKRAKAGTRPKRKRR
jgi:AcrR family transcriptional regulator